MGCQLLVETRDLIEEVETADWIEDVEEDELKEITEGITFLGKVTTTEVATIRKLMQGREGDEPEYEEEDSWGKCCIYMRFETSNGRPDDIAEEVQVVLNKLDIFWPPTPRSSPVGNDKRRRGSQDDDGSGHKDADIDLPPTKVAKGDDDKDKSKSKRKKGSKGGKGKGKGGEPEPSLGQDEGLSKKDERAQANAVRVCMGVCARLTYMLS